MNMAPLLGSPLQRQLDDMETLSARLKVFTGLIVAFGLLAIAGLGAQMFIVVARHSVASALLALALYIIGFTAIAIARAAATLRVVLAATGAAILFALAVDLATQSDWGNTILYVLIALVIYRLSTRWSIPAALVAGVALLFSNGLDTLIGIHLTSDDISLAWSTLILYAFVLVMGGSLRARYLLLQRLQETQHQLRMEMERTAELAMAHERTRIARDIHDVLAHSLTVLSVQTQATRALLREQPERAAAMLDEMGKMLRESLAESRRVVGLLREVDPAQAETGALGVRLHALTETFGERTGVRCAFHEVGTARVVSGEAVETLRYALLEALTNAYRHGAARHVWVELRWQEKAQKAHEEATVTLIVRDDGAGKGASGGSSVGSGNGLRGMRERVAALHGSVQAEPQAEGGFTVEVELPVMQGQEQGQGQEQIMRDVADDAPVAAHGAA